MRSSTSGRRSARQGLSPSSSFAVTRSRIGGSTVLTAANIHVIARARALVSVGQQTGMALCEMKDDGTRLEQREIALFVGRDLAKRMKREMRGFLQCPK